MSDKEEVDNEDVGDGDSRCVQQSGRIRSAVWDNFTILDKKNHIASCNYCDKKLSFRTTVTNLKKHVIRKHPVGGIPYSNSAYDSSGRSRISFQIPQGENKTYENKSFLRKRLTDIGGLEGLVINVIGEDGEAETIIPDHEENQEEVYTDDAHNYCATDNRHGQEEKSPSKEQRANKPQNNIDPMEKKKRSKIMDLQLECLEIKKYNMQLEARLLEQQLNLRRSVFTDSLRNADSITRGTQTEVGGENTRIFYLADGKGGVPTRHLFTMQEME